MTKYILNGELDIEPLISARNFLQKALQQAQSELEIAGTIQAFEVSYELAYKTCRKVLSLRGTHVYTAKEVFRISSLEGLIMDAEPWLNYVGKRKYHSSRILRENHGRSLSNFASIFKRPRHLN